MVVRLRLACVLLIVAAAAQAQVCDTGSPLLRGEREGGPEGSPDGSVILTTPYDRARRLIRAQDLQEIAILPPGWWTFARDGSATIHAAGEFRVLDYGGRELKHVSGVAPIDSEYALAFDSASPPGSGRWAHAQARTYRVADAVRGEPFGLPQLYRRTVVRGGRVAFFNSGVLGPSEPNFNVVDLRTGRELFRQRMEPDAKLVELSADGKRVLVSNNRYGDQGLVLLLDADSGKRLAEYRGAQTGRFTRDGTRILLSGSVAAGVAPRDNPAAVVRPPGFGNADPVHVFELANGLVGAWRYPEMIAFDRDWREVYRVPAGSSHLAYKTGDLPGPAEWQSGRYVAFSNTGSGDDVTFTIYDVNTGRRVCALKGDPARMKHPKLTALTDGFFAIESFADFPVGSRWALYRLEDPGSVQAAPARVIEEARDRSAALSEGERARAQNYFLQAFEFFKAGEFDAAVRRFAQGLEIDPANAVAHYYLAETYARLKNNTLARTHYQRTIDFAPDSKEAVLAQTRMRPGATTTP